MASPESPYFSGKLNIALGALLLGVAAVMTWQGLAWHGVPDPTQPQGKGGASLSIAVLVFREGLESVLVLAAILATMVGFKARYRNPVVAGCIVGGLATAATWLVAVRVLDDLTQSYPALQVQAITGLLAIIVLLVVMNWFFHSVYWSGWIGMHNRAKRALIAEAEATGAAAAGRVAWGLGLLGFASVYREGLEVVLFLQSYRMRLGTPVVLGGTLVGLLLAGIVAAATFVAHRTLPFRKMLVFTGVMLGAVLLVMVGEQMQEMQQAKWFGVTEIPSLASRLPAWCGLWLGIFPNWESMIAQGVAAVLVAGSYFGVRLGLFRRLRKARALDAGDAAGDASALPAAQASASPR